MIDTALNTLRDVGNALIWLAVYSPILLVIFIAYRLLQRFHHPKTSA